MDRRLTRQRVRLGMTTRVVAEDPDGIALEGESRLWPGREVDLVFSALVVPPPAPRRAVVWSWRFVGMGNAGPLYRGYCRWA